MFLRSRRAKLRPSDLGLAEGVRSRRVPGLRREELAAAADISVAYYIRMEQGRAGHVSDEVIEAVARALQLNPSERGHLHNLARASHRGRPTTGSGAGSLDGRLQGIQALLSALRGAAYVVGPRGDILAWNSATTALFGPWRDLAPEERNWGRLLFDSPGYRDLFVDWRGKAFDYVGYLRGYAGRWPDDPELGALVDRLASVSGTFRQMWESHDVKDLAHGVKVLRHPRAGILRLRFENLALPSDPELLLVSFHPEPGSDDEERFDRLLARVR